MVVAAMVIAASFRSAPGIGAGASAAAIGPNKRSHQHACNYSVPVHIVQHVGKSKRVEWAAREQGVVDKRAASSPGVAHKLHMHVYIQLMIADQACG